MADTAAMEFVAVLLLGMVSVYAVVVRILVMLLLMVVMLVVVRLIRISLIVRMVRLVVVRREEVLVAAHPRVTSRQMGERRC